MRSFTTSAVMVLLATTLNLDTAFAKTTKTVSSIRYTSVTVATVNASTLKIDSHLPSDKPRIPIGVVSPVPKVRPDHTEAPIVDAASTTILTLTVYNSTVTIATTPTASIPSGTLPGKADAVPTKSAQASPSASPDSLANVPAAAGAGSASPHPPPKSEIPTPRIGTVADGAKAPAGKNNVANSSNNSTAVAGGTTKAAAGGNAGTGSGNPVPAAGSSTASRNATKPSAPTSTVASFTGDASANRKAGMAALLVGVVGVLTLIV